MRSLVRAAPFAVLLAIAAPGGSAAQRGPQQTSPADTATGPTRASVGIGALGFSPQGEFADNVGFAGGFGGSLVFRLDPEGVVALRADVSYLVYGRERYRTPLGTGPLGLIEVDVVTTNSIVGGGLGLQLLAPGPTVRPYANATAGFSYFFTSSSVEGTDDNEAFASSTNYEDGGFAWTVGGGLYIPLASGRTPVNLDLGVKWIDNGKRDYLRDDGITFENGDVHLHPVSSEAKGVQYTLGITIGIR